VFLTLYGNEKGELFEHPRIGMVGRSGDKWLVPEEKEMIPLPRGSSIIRIPGYIPVGLGENQNITCFDSDPFSPKQKVYAVGALLPQGFTRSLLPAGVSSDNACRLPLLGYAAVAFRRGKIYAAAIKTDEHRKWHPVYYNTEGLPARIGKMLKRFPKNRILRQLARCSLEYGCFTAQNIFYQRWEGGIPTMNKCNADCLGCISEAHWGGDSPQERISFSPSVDEIAEIGAFHLAQAKDAIISFGQGCEGEPSLNAENISLAIKKIRTLTSRGTINMNTNAGYTRGIKLITDAGLNSIRVTVFSFTEENYNRYHCPRNYTLDSVKRSIAYCHYRGVKTSINLLVFPGFTDREEEIDSLFAYLRENQIDMVQLRNLNIDPELLMQAFPVTGQPVGIATFIELLQREFPHIKLGSYTDPA
jgi:pyruvate-formate lyase-activating enzyme